MSSSAEGELVLGRLVSVHNICDCDSSATTDSLNESSLTANYGFIPPGAAGVGGAHE